MLPPTPASTSTSTHMQRNADLKSAAQKFEAVIVRQLIAQMRKSETASDIFGSSAGQGFRELADARTADTIAARGAFGIGALVEQQYRKAP
jgi:peptidoglycan hydrolase FlgJ